MIPFKVVCVARKPGKWRNSEGIAKGPCYGDICNVTEIHEDEDGVYYFLQEYSSNGEAYLAKHFKPLSDTTIEQVIQNLKEEPETA